MQTAPSSLALVRKAGKSGNGFRLDQDRFFLGRMYFHNRHVDPALSRSLPLHETLPMTSRLDAFNGFNHPNWSCPG